MGTDSRVNLKANTKKICGDQPMNPVQWTSMGTIVTIEIRWFLEFSRFFKSAKTLGPRGFRIANSIGWIGFLKETFFWSQWIQRLPRIRVLLKLLDCFRLLNKSNFRSKDLKLLKLSGDFYCSEEFLMKFLMKFPLKFLLKNSTWNFCWNCTSKVPNSHSTLRPWKQKTFAGASSARFVLPFRLQSTCELYKRNWQFVEFWRTGLDFGKPIELGKSLWISTDALNPMPEIQQSSSRQL